MPEVTNVFWDSCVFYAYFSNNTDAYDVDGIEQYVKDARQGSVVIHTCAVALAEVVPSAFRGGPYGDFPAFMKDIRGGLRVVNLDPNVMLLAGQLKDLPYQKSNGSRKLGTGDAIMLAACISLSEAYSVTVDAFHTFDDGKKRGEDGGKGVPLLTYEKWCEGFDVSQKALARKVINLNRCHPQHPSPSLL
ncbi:MAG: hypothetical protein H7840_00370 [Alphaproteobacteria bacterium]